MRWLKKDARVGSGESSGQKAIKVLNNIGLKHVYTTVGMHLWPSDIKAVRLIHNLLFVVVAVMTYIITAFKKSNTAVTNIIKYYCAGLIMRKIILSIVIGPENYCPLYYSSKFEWPAD